VRAVAGVDLTVGRGRTVCVVGESGCGKSVTARSILGLVDRPGEITAGSVLWHGGGRKTPVDLAKLDPHSEEMRRIRGAEISMVFQEPMASLSPMYTVGDQLVETIRLHLPMNREEAREHAVALVFSDWRQCPTTSDALQMAGWTWQGKIAWIKPASRPRKGGFKQSTEYILWGVKGTLVALGFLVGGAPVIWALLPIALSSVVSPSVQSSK
jgi:ABC-type arginine transport system ATPase subunit